MFQLSIFLLILTIMLRFLLALVFFSGLSLQAQKDRFLKEIFDSVRVVTVTYSDVYQDAAHKADIYAPAKDTAGKRPLLIYVHGGSFIAGDKGSADCVDFCARFAKMGYTAVSVNYRLGTLMQFMQSKDYQMQTVMRSLADIKAAIRFFVADAKGNNIYRTDPARIFLGGYSAGAVAALHTAYIDSLSELTASEQQLLKSSIGTLDGDAGNAGHSFNIKALFSLAGALHKPEWVSPGEEPVWLAHSRDDGTVSYNCAPGLGLPNVLELCGTGKLMPALRSKNVLYDSMILEKEGHGWPSGGNGNADFRAALDKITLFFYPMVASKATQVSEISGMQQGIRISPNPASTGTILRISAQRTISFIRLYQPDGKLIVEQKCSSPKNEVSFTIPQLPPGIYWMETESGCAKLVIER
jgi:acetyl esterase/lipase